MESDPELKRVEGAFNEAMFRIYDEARSKYHYNASRFLQMLHNSSGVEVARSLTLAPDASDGFTKLWELKRLDLTVEAHILKPEYHVLFTDADRDAARTRLELYGWHTNP